MFKKSCLICTREFTVSWGGAKYCSRDCYHKATIKYSPKECPICKKQFLAHEKRTFCSRECWHKHLESRRITKVCLSCGNKFEVPPIFKSRRYCNKVCRLAKTQYATCERCGKRFRFSGHKRRHCSEICRRPPIISSCPTCGKTFRKTPTSPRQYCSRHCYHTFRGENRLEKRFRKTLEQLNIPFRQEVPFGRFYCVDFTVDNQKLAIEVDGDYWHDKNKDEKKDAFLRSLGWHVIRFKQSELDNAPDFKEFVVSRLTGERVIQ